MSGSSTHVHVWAALVSAVLLASTAWVVATPVVVAQEGSTTPEGVCVGWPVGPTDTIAETPITIAAAPSGPEQTAGGITATAAVSSGGTVQIAVAPRTVAGTGESAPPAAVTRESTLPALWYGQDYYSPPEQ